MWITIFLRKTWDHDSVTIRIFSQPKLLQHSNLKIMAFHRQYYGGLPLIGGCWRCCMYKNDTSLIIASFKPKKTSTHWNVPLFSGTSMNIALLHYDNRIFLCLWLRTFCFSLLWKVSRLSASDCLLLPAGSTRGENVPRQFTIIRRIDWQPSAEWKKWARGSFSATYENEHRSGSRYFFTPNYAAPK